MKFTHLFPDKRNQYQGYKAIIFITAFLTLVSTLRSLIHIILPEGGAEVIAGMVLSGPLKDVVIFTFAWAGFYQLIFAIIQWIVLIRYREFLPVILFLMFLEQLALFLISFFKPIPANVLTHTPPEAIGNKILLPLVFLLFLASLIIKCKPIRKI
jgi:hypothetical protein